MNEAFAQALAAYELALRLSLPLLGAAFAVALVFTIVSMLTRVSEPALGALPRALVTLLVLGGSASWMARELVAYAAQLFRALPALVP